MVGPAEGAMFSVVLGRWSLVLVSVSCSPRRNDKAARAWPQLEGGREGKRTSDVQSCAMLIDCGDYRQAHINKQERNRGMKTLLVGLVAVLALSVALGTATAQDAPKK